MIASPWNSAEKTYDQRNITDPDALDAAGDAQLVAGHSQAALSFIALDTNSTAYGRDFFMGDVILSQFRGLVLPKKIVGIENTVADGRESLRIHFDDEINTLLAGVACLNKSFAVWPHVFMRSKYEKRHHRRRVWLLICLRRPSTNVGDYGSWSTDAK